MTTTADLYDTIKASGALFNVRRERIMTESGATSHKYGIVNCSNNRIVGIVSDGYKVVSNDEIINATLSALEVSHLDLTDATATVKMNSEGSRVLVDFILPAHSVLTRNNKTSLRISTLNSYDLAWKYQSKVGGIRMACLNGNIMGKVVSSYSEFHNSNLDVTAGAARMLKMCDEFMGSKEWYTAMMRRPVDEFDVEELAAKFFDVTLAELKDLRPYKHFRETLDGYFHEMGRNAYALYNAFTDYITHKRRSEKAAASSLVKDEAKMKMLVDRSSVFA